MAGATTSLATRAQAAGAARRDARRDPLVVRVLLIGISLAFLLFFLGLPLVAVFAEALRKGWGVYLHSFDDRAVAASIRLTLTVAAIAVPLNAIFGLLAAWAIAKFDFRGKNLLISVIDLPFAISPVIAGMVFVLLFSRRHGWLQGPLNAIDLNVIFALPGIVLATVFVTFPFVARELIPLMQEQGTADEEAALSLGASGWQTFWRVTLPNIRWALLYGLTLCNARAMGEFGAVSVVSGSVAGRSSTIPLHIETLYASPSTSTAAFALASLLALLALVTLLLKSLIEWRVGKAHD